MEAVSGIDVIARNAVTRWFCGELRIILLQQVSSLRGTK